MTAREMRARPPTKTNHFRRLKSGQRPSSAAPTRSEQKPQRKLTAKVRFLLARAPPSSRRRTPRRPYSIRRRSAGRAALELPTARSATARARGTLARPGAPGRGSLGTLASRGGWSRTEPGSGQRVAGGCRCLTQTIRTARTRPKKNPYTELNPDPAEMTSLRLVPVTSPALLTIVAVSPKQVDDVAAEMPSTATKGLANTMMMSPALSLVRPRLLGSGYLERVAGRAPGSAKSATELEGDARLLVRHHERRAVQPHSSMLGPRWRASPLRLTCASPADLVGRPNPGFPQ
jgi:hypothetical protein